MEDSLSIIDYLKKKYNIEHFDEIISIMYLSLLASIIIYLSMQFEVIKMSLVIFIVLFFSIYIINQHYKKKYDEQVTIMNEKIKYIGELLQKISSNNISS
jgi:ABC-type multidrug transport system fused ATPase/permease subunit